jgi:septal ring factor EnvC (AmiA/AmiB activator)
MAHVMIPAREDVESGVVHHSGITQPISLTGEGCEVEQVNSNAFVIRVSQPAYEAFTAITDLSPIWDALQDLEADVKSHSKETESAFDQIRDTIRSYTVDAVDVDQSISALKVEIEKLTANQVEARQKQTYVLLAAAMTMIFSLLAVGIALWTSKV